MITDCAGSGRKVLLTGGRAPVTLQLARMFHEAGHRVFVAESARYYLCRVSASVEQCFVVPPPNRGTTPFLNALESIVIQNSIDLVIPTCEEIFHVAKGLARLSRHCRVWAAPLPELQMLHNKWEFIELARRCGFPTPRTELIRSPEQWLELGAAQRAKESLVLKPVYSRFASRVMLLSADQTLSERQLLLAGTAQFVSENTTWVAQQYVSGTEISTYSIAYGGKLVAHAAYPCRYRISRGATVYFDPVDHKPARDWVLRFVKDIGFTGQIAFDFIEADDGTLYPLECNPRATSGIHLFSGNDRLEEAFLHPERLQETGTVKTPSTGVQSMLSLPMLLCGLWNARRPKHFAEWWRCFRKGKDIVFQTSDLKPLWEQLRIIWALFRISRDRRVPLSEATTYDIAWNGE